MKAIGYVRVSTKMQVDKNNSIGMLAGGKITSIGKEYETTEGGHPAVKAMRTTRDKKGDLQFSKFIMYK